MPVWERAAVVGARDELPKFAAHIVRGWEQLVTYCKRARGEVQLHCVIPIAWLTAATWEGARMSFNQNIGEQKELPVSTNALPSALGDATARLKRTCAAQAAS